MKVLDYILNKFTRLQIKIIGKHCYVYAKCGGFNKSKRFLLLLDTGCTRTTLSKGFLERSGLLVEEDEKCKVQTAGGITEMHRAIIPNMNIQGLKYSNLKINYTTKNLSSHAAGILGMDILGRFNFFVDMDDKALYLCRNNLQTSNISPTNIDEVAYINTDITQYHKNYITDEQLELIKNCLPPTLVKEIFG